MSKKTLNQRNLEHLGPEKLAALVMDLVQGNASLQRRARMELSAAQGPKEVIADVRKRFVSLRRSTSFVGWRKQKAFVKDLRAILSMIELNILPHDPDEAFELLWSFLLLAPSIHERTDDSNGSIGDVLADVVQMIAQLSPKIAIDNKSLAARILDAVADAGYGEFDGIIPATAEALGDDGLEHLKQLAKEWQSAPPREQELERYRGYGLTSSPEDTVRRSKDLTGSIILADIADAQGDVDAYMARYSAEQLTYGTIAPGVARRLLDAGRMDEAHAIILRARTAEEGRSFPRFRPHLDEVYEECLERMGMTDELKKHFWVTFEQYLCARSLRSYLKLLPDFDDFEAEERALSFAKSYAELGTAVRFLIEWSALESAAEIILARAEELNGNSYQALSIAADAMESEQPLAATVMRRAMVQDTLNGGKSKRYRHAARHLAECGSCDPAISDYLSFQTHTQFVETLKTKHARKYGFWQLVER